MADDNATSLADERRRLLHELEVERNQLLRNIGWCRIRDIERPFIGEWTLKDIVGHIASWEAEVVAALRELREGRHAAVLAFDLRDLESWNRDHVLRKREVDFSSLLEQLRGGRVRLLEELAQLSDEELIDGGQPAGRLAQAVAGHDRHHWHAIAARVAGMPGTRDEGPDSVPEEAAAGS
jgi:hypothetical protein